VGEGLVKLIMCSDVPGCWVDVGRSGTFLLYSCKVAFWTQETPQNCLMSSTQSFHGPCLWSVVHSLICSFSGICHSSTVYPMAKQQTLGWEGLGTRLKSMC